MLGTILLYDSRLLLTNDDHPPAPDFYPQTSPVAVWKTTADGTTEAGANNAQPSPAPQPPPLPVTDEGRRLCLLTGLEPGAVFTGTVLTNFKITCP